MTGTTLRGFATINFWADDVATARDWYADFLGIPAYFERSYADGRLVYAEFRLGDYQAELGIVDQRFARPRPPADRAGRSCTGTLTTYLPPSNDCCPWAPQSISRSRNAAKVS
jgi:hypothetical protein